MSQADIRITSVNHPTQGAAGEPHTPLHPDNLHDDLRAMSETVRQGLTGNAKAKRAALLELATDLCRLEKIIGQDVGAAKEACKREPLSNVRSDLENIQADLCSHSGLLNFLGDSQGIDAGEPTLASAFYALANSSEAIRGGLEDIVRRLMDLEDRPPNVTDADLRALAIRAWKERGIVVLWPEKISDNRQRSQLLNLATREYGPRHGNAAPFVIKIERIKTGKAGGK